jgi:hypothetical protein
VVFDAVVCEVDFSLVFEEEHDYAVFFVVADDFCLVVFDAVVCEVDFSLVFGVEPDYVVCEENYYEDFYDAESG